MDEELKELYAKRYQWLRDKHSKLVGNKVATVIFWLDEPYEPEDADELDRMVDNFLSVKSGKKS